MAHYQGNWFMRFFERQIQAVLDRYVLPRIEHLLFSRKFSRHLQHIFRQALHESPTEKGGYAFFSARDCHSLRMITEELLRKEVELVTSSGTIKGRIVEVKDDYVSLQETAAFVMIPFTSIILIREP